MKFYNMAISYGVDGGRVESIESDRGKWAKRDDAEEAAKDAVRAAKVALLLLQNVYKPKDGWVSELTAIIERYEGGKG